jgi:hypothetical protein
VLVTIAKSEEATDEQRFRHGFLNEIPNIHLLRSQHVFCAFEMEIDSVKDIAIPVDDASVYR